MENQEKLIIIEDIAGIESLSAYLSDKSYVAYDTETTGLAIDAQVVGFSLAADVDTGYYVILARWDAALQKLVWCFDEFRKAAIKLLESLKSKNLITHNGIVDVQWSLRNFGVDLLESIHTDTMILAHVCDENRASYGLKELAFEEFGEMATVEKEEMSASVIANGGIWENKRGGNKEMYKADPYILAKYGAKDTILTLKLFYLYIPGLFGQKLEKFFYEEESMPLFKTGTYQLNMTGMAVDMPKLKQLEADLTKHCELLMSQIMHDVLPMVKKEYPGDAKCRTFNIGSSQQLSWLLYFKLGNDWKKLTKGGRKIAKELIEKVPYNPKARREFVKACLDSELKPWKYLSSDKKSLLNVAHKYKWVERLLEYKKELKLLNTYATGMQKFARYGVIRPSFKQHGTTSGRYSSSQPNFQNLPRDDKRIKSCIVARPGHVFVGADYSQLEPRVFTAQSQDPLLMAGFRNREDFYSVIGIPVFHKFECSANKDAPNYFGKVWPVLRQIAKVIALSLAYGTTPYKLSDELRDEEGHNLPVEACQEIRDGYFENYKGVAKFVHDSHLQIVKNGVVFNQFGRPRRIKEAKVIKTFGFPKSCSVEDLSYQYRTLMNLAVNHRVQSTAASIVNRATIAFCAKLKEHNIMARVVLQVHDEIIVECLEKDAMLVSRLLKEAMENTVALNGVDLIAEPKIGRTLAELK